MINVRIVRRHHAFFEGEIPGYKQQMFGNHTVKTRFDFAGLVLDYNEETKIVTMQQRNFFKPGDEVEFFGPEIENFTQKIGTIWDEAGKELEAARHPLQIVRIQVDNTSLCEQYDAEGELT